MQRDATTVPTVSGGRGVGSFAEGQQLVEGAPLMRNAVMRQANRRLIGHR